MIEVTWSMAGINELTLLLLLFGVTFNPLCVVVYNAIKFLNVASYLWCCLKLVKFF